MAQFAIGMNRCVNCALGGARSGFSERVSTFRIRRYEAPDRVVESEVLPSFLYLREDAKPTGVPYWAGLVAREQFKNDGTLHSFGEVWLCHSGVDGGAILPGIRRRCRLRNVVSSGS